MRMFRTAGPGRNNDPKIALMRKADTAAISNYSSGGLPKRKGPRAVTLPTLDSARKLINETREAAKNG